MAEYALREVARANDVDLTAASVDRLDLGGVEISDVRVGADGVQRVSRVRVNWSPSQLLGGRVETVEVTGARVTVDVNSGGGDSEGGLSVEGLPHPGGGGRAPGRLAFPETLGFNRLDVSDSEVEIRLPDGAARLSVDGSVDAGPGKLRGALVARYSAETTRGAGAGSGTVGFSWMRGEAPHVEFDLRFDRFLAAGVSATGVRVVGASEYVPDGGADLSVRAELSAASVDAGGIEARDVSVVADLAGGIADVAVRGRALELDIEASTRLHVPDLSHPAGFRVAARGDVSGVAALLPALSAVGDMSLALDGTVDDPRALLENRGQVAERPLRLGEYGTAQLDIELDLRRLALADGFEAGAAVARASASWDGTHLDVDVGVPTRLEDVVPAPRFMELLAAWLPAATPFDLAFGEGMGAPPTFRVDFPEDRVRVHGVAGLRARLPAGSASVEADAMLALDSARRLERLSVATMTATFDELPTTHGVLSGDVLVDNLGSDGRKLAAAVSGDLQVDRFVAPSLSAHRAALTIDGTVAMSDDMLALTATGPGSFRVRDVRLSGGFRLSGDNAFALAPGEHRLAFDRNSGTLSLDLDLAADKARMVGPRRDIETGLGRMSVSGSWPGRLTVVASGLSAGLGQGRELRVGELRLDADGDLVRNTVSLDAAGMDFVLPGFALPAFRATGTISRRGPSLGGALDLVAAGGAPRIRMRANHDLRTGRGKAEIEDAELRFAPGVLQPADLMPGRKFVLEDVFATLSLAGTLAWRGGELEPDLRLEIADAAAATDNLELRDAALSVRLTGLPDVRTPPAQAFRGLVRVGRLTPMPVEGTFQLRTDPAAEFPQLIVEGIRVDLLPGSLQTGRFVVSPPEIDTEMKVRIEGADLANAFDILDVEGVGGTGTVSGMVRTVVRGERVGIMEGRLTSDGPGRLFFDISAIPPALSERGDAVSLVLRALSNFSYSKMELDLDKSLDGPGTVRVRLQGANPEVLEGHPFDFNIALETDFDRLTALILDGLNTSQGLLRALAEPKSEGF